MIDDKVVNEVREMQASMLGAASEYFEHRALENLRCVVRLAVEYLHDLTATAGTNLSADELSYRADSVFSGLDSFWGFCSDYRWVPDAIEKSGLTWPAISRAALEEQFLELYPSFVNESDFPKRCRVLLDLYKLQLVLAGMTYSDIPEPVRL